VRPQGGKADNSPLLLHIDIVYIMSMLLRLMRKFIRITIIPVKLRNIKYNKLLPVDNIVRYQIIGQCQNDPAYVYCIDQVLASNYFY